MTQTPAVTPRTVQTTLVPHVGVEAVHVDRANHLLVAWGHDLGACNRPFGAQAFALHLEGSRA